MTCTRPPAECQITLDPRAPSTHDPQTLFNYVASQLAGRCLAYLHVIEGDTSGTTVPPFDYRALKRLFGGLVMANNGFDKRRANAAVADGEADLVAFGKPFIANPDLVVRLLLDAPLMAVDPDTLYGGGEAGYTDYPTLRAVAPNTCFRDKERAWG
jgi:N-ethylmaleimide reductase